MENSNAPQRDLIMSKPYIKPPRWRNVVCSLPFLAVLLVMLSALLAVAIWAIVTHAHPASEKRADFIIKLSPTVPQNASDIVDRGYPGLAMSSHSFWEYAGNASSPNYFSANLIQTISNRTGAPVHIRVGGTSGDFAFFNTSQQTALVYPPGTGPADIPHGLRIGKAWFEGLANFQNVKWTYMAHLANNSAGFMENTVQAVQEALKYIGPNLDNIEIGNEIDYYPVSNPRTKILRRSPVEDTH